MSETTKPPEISAEVRHAMMALVYELDKVHASISRYDPFHSPDTCRRCQIITDALKVLDDNQRLYGPAIDVSDPSYTGGPA